MPDTVTASTINLLSVAQFYKAEGKHSRWVDEGARAVVNICVIEFTSFCFLLYFTKLNILRAVLDLIKLSVITDEKVILFIG